VRPSVEFSLMDLAFPDTCVGDTSDINLTITNTNEELPIYFNAAKMAQFKAFPGDGKLLPLQSQDIIIRFFPKQVFIVAFITHLAWNLHKNIGV
jgi:hypothetical protein